MDQQTHVTYEPAHSAFFEQRFNLTSLIGRRYIVDGDRPLLTPAARAAELKEWSKVHKTYKVDYSIPRGKGKIGKSTRVSNGSTG